MVGGDYEVSFYGFGAVTRMGSSRRIIRYAHPGPSNVSNFGFFMPNPGIILRMIAS